MIGLLMLAATASGFYTGNAIYAICTSQNEYDKAACSLYVAGVFDMASIASPATICSPPGVTRSQVKDVAVKWLADNPTNRNEGAAGLIAVAVEKAFPCR